MLPSCILLGCLMTPAKVNSSKDSLLGGTLEETQHQDGEKPVCGGASRVFRSEPLPGATGAQRSSQRDWPSSR